METELLHSFAAMISAVVKFVWSCVNRPTFADKHGKTILEPRDADVLARPMAAPTLAEALAESAAAQRPQTVAIGYQNNRTLPNDVVIGIRNTSAPWLPDTAQAVVRTEVDEIRERLRREHQARRSFVYEAELREEAEREFASKVPASGIKSPEQWVEIDNTVNPVFVRTCFETEQVTE